MHIGICASLRTFAEHLQCTKLYTHCFTYIFVSLSPLEQSMLLQYQERQEEVDQRLLEETSLNASTDSDSSSVICPICQKYALPLYCTSSIWATFFFLFFSIKYSDRRCKMSVIKVVWAMLGCSDMLGFRLDRQGGTLPSTMDGSFSEAN